MEVAVAIALLASGGFLLVGLATGVWKYSHMMGSADGVAPQYVNIAHRASLLYAFAALVIYEFAQLSPFSPTVTAAAVTVPIVFFALAVTSYVVHGVLQDTDNQFREPPRPNAVRGFMWALIVGEFAGIGLLVVGAAWVLIV